jgi:hypothetical protein
MEALVKEQEATLRARCVTPPVFSKSGYHMYNTVRVFNPYYNTEESTRMAALGLPSEHAKYLSIRIYQRNSKGLREAAKVGNTLTWTGRWVKDEDGRIVRFDAIDFK